MTTLDDLLTPEQVAFINRSAHAHLLDKDVDTITFFELRVIAAIINKTEYGFESDLHKLITLLLA